MPAAIGIDLGTTNSVVAFLDGSRVEVAPNPEGARTTPSVVMYKDDAEILVGEHAKRQIVMSPTRVVKSIKRVMGKRFEELGEESEHLPFKPCALDDGMAGVELEGGVVIRPEEVSADILDYLRRMAEDFIGEDVTQAVITVPAHFNDQQRTATKAAAEMAGLEVLRIVNEPTAAALAYGMGNADAGGNLAVFDFGGGTFDISILSISNDIFEVLATNGDNHLGGDDVDTMVFNEICKRIHAQTSVNPRSDLQAVQRIREAAEKAKCELSSLSVTTIALPFIVADASGPKHFEMELTREHFNTLCEPIFQRLLEPCRRCMADAGLDPSQVQDVLLVGGSTRIPRVQELVAGLFGREPNRSVNPDEAIAMGAAIQSGVISGALREVLLLDVTPLTLGIELAGGIFKPLIPRNSTVPCEARSKFTTVVDNQTSVMVHVLQGERLVAGENHSLARFRLTGIPPAPKELPEIEVHFSIDANGILSVHAVDLATGSQTGVVVENYGEISARREHIERMIAAAQENLDADEAFVRFGERRAEVDRLRLRVEELIDLGGDAVSEDDAKRLKAEMFRLDLATEARDTRRMEGHRDAILELLEKHEDLVELQRQLGAAGLGGSRPSTPRMQQLPTGVDSVDEPEAVLAQPAAPAAPTPAPAPVPVPEPPKAQPRRRMPAHEEPDPDALRAPQVEQRVESYEDDDDFNVSLAPPPPPPR